MLKLSPGRILVSTTGITPPLLSWKRANLLRRRHDKEGIRAPKEWNQQQRETEARHPQVAKVASASGALVLRHGCWLLEPNTSLLSLVLSTRTPHIAHHGAPCLVWKWSSSSWLAKNKTAIIPLTHTRLFSVQAPTYLGAHRVNTVKETLAKQA